MDSAMATIGAAAMSAAGGFGGAWLIFRAKAQELRVQQESAIPLHYHTLVGDMRAEVVRLQATVDRLEGKIVRLEDTVQSLEAQNARLNAMVLVMTETADESPAAAAAAIRRRV